MTILSPVQPAARRREAPAVKQLIPAIAADGSFYPIEKMDAHRRAVQHLAVSVFVFSDDELLLQRRAESKYHCGGLWANTCCTHPYWNEADDVSAERRLMEEMGLNLSLTPVPSSNIRHRFLRGCGRTNGCGSSRPGWIGGR